MKSFEKKKTNRARNQGRRTKNGLLKQDHGTAASESAIASNNDEYEKSWNRRGKRKAARFVLKEALNESLDMTGENLTRAADKILGEDDDGYMLDEDYYDNRLYEEQLHTMLGDAEYEKALRGQLKSINFEISLLPPESDNEPKTVMNKRYTLEEQRDEIFSTLRNLNGDGVSEATFGVPSRDLLDKRRAKEVMLDHDNKEDDDGIDYEPTRVIRNK
jgi:hypothetical protein